jgi:hypothetical protein
MPSLKTFSAASGGFVGSGVAVGSATGLGVGVGGAGVGLGAQLATAKTSPATTISDRKQRITLFILLSFRIVLKLAGYVFPQKTRERTHTE